MLFAAPGLKQTSVSHSLAHNILPSSSPSFSPSGLLRLHCMPLTFSPAPLSPESLENPSDQRWVSQKLLDFGAVHSPLSSSSSPPLQATPPRPLTGLNLPPQRQHCLHYWDTVTSRNHKEPSINFEVQSSNNATKPARAAAALLPLSCLMAFYYSNHYCHLQYTWRTALWEALWEFEYI